MSDLAPLLLGALLVGVVWRMRMGFATVLVAARTRAGPRPISIARHGVRRHRPGVSLGLAVMVIADVGAILLLPVHSWISWPVPGNPSCRPAWLPSWMPFFGSHPFFSVPALSSCLLSSFPVPAPGLLNAPSSHWVCTLRSGRRDRGSFEQGVRLSAGFQRNDSTTSLPKLASPSTATKIALGDPGAPWQDRKGRGRCAGSALVTGRVRARQDRWWWGWGGFRAQAVRRQLRAWDVVVSGDRARQSRETVAYSVKGRRETGRRQGGWKILCPPGLARAEGVY